MSATVPTFLCRHGGLQFKFNMKKSYKFLCIFTCLVIVLSCSLFASAKMVRPYEYEWTGKELFDNVKDKRFYFNSGTQYLSTSASYASSYAADYLFTLLKFPLPLNKEKVLVFFSALLICPTKFKLITAILLNTLYQHTWQIMPAII